MAKLTSIRTDAPTTGSGLEQTLIQADQAYANLTEEEKYTLAIQKIEQSAQVASDSFGDVSPFYNLANLFSNSALAPLYTQLVVDIINGSTPSQEQVDAALYEINFLYPQRAAAQNSMSGGSGNFVISPTVPLPDVGASETFPGDPETGSPPVTVTDPSTQPIQLPFPNPGILPGTPEPPTQLPGGPIGSPPDLAPIQPPITPQPMPIAANPVFDRRGSPISRGLYDFSEFAQYTASQSPKIQSNRPIAGTSYQRSEGEDPLELRY